MAATKTHNSNEISVTYAGRDLATGRAEGDFCTSEYTKELHTLKVGADGEVTRIRSNDRSAKIMLKFMRTSDANKIMMGLYALAIASPNGQDIAPLQIRDRNLGVVEHADEAWIAKAPTMTSGADVGEVEWELHAAELVREEE